MTHCFISVRQHRLFLLYQGTSQDCVFLLRQTRTQKNGIPRIKIALPWRNSGARVPQISLRQETTRARRAEPGVRRESVQNSRLASRELPASAEAERARPPRTHTDEQSEANSRFARTAGEPPFASHVERSNDCRRQTQRKRPVAATYALSCERSTSKAPLGAHRIQ